MSHEGLMRENLRCDGLVDDVKVRGGILLIRALANAVDLVVDGRTMMVAILTGTGDGPLDVRRMPCTDTSNLSQTFVRLSWKLLRSPSAGYTLEAVALGDGDAIDHLVLLEDGINLDGLLEQSVAELDLVRDAAAVDLDFHQMCLLLLERCLTDLGVCENTDNGAVFLDALELAGDGGALVLGVLLCVLGESLLLRSVPVLVKSSLQFVAEMFSPDGREGSEAAWGFDVADEADDNHLSFKSACTSRITSPSSYWGGLDDSDGFDNLFLVHLRTRSIKVTDNGGHPGLVPHGSGKMDWFLWVILWKAVDSLQLRLSQGES